MIEFLPVHENNVLAVRMSGKLTYADYQDFIPKIETQIKRYGKISILIELDDFSGWELAAASEDFKFGLKHRDDIERFAFVGRKTWQRWMSHMAKPFVTGKVKYFPHDDLLKAWDWVRNKDEEVTDDLVQETDKAESQDNSELKPYTKILVAIDFSAHSIQASKRAAELAKYYDAELTILHMVEERSIYDSYYNPIDMSLMLENQPLFDSETITIHNEKVRKMGKKHLQSLADKIGVDKVKTEVLGGSTASGIISYAAAQQTDLIVMGTHGRHGFSRIMGSVARSVQGGAHCEVLIVPLQ